MKKTLLFAFAFTLTVLFGLTSCERHDDTPTGPNDTTATPSSSIGGFDQDGASNATFSIGDGVVVQFSRGNLQYQASTGTWRFAEHQYDYIGADNANISSTYSGWIDLFGWGTSGWNSGATCYQPWSTGTSSSYYYPGGDYTNSLTGEYVNADWGVYNAISNGGNRIGMWRVLTRDEFEYLMFNRSSSSLGGTTNARFAKATVAGNEGLIIFPDNFTMPSSLNMVSSINSIDVSYDVNAYNSNQWEQMESNGAVFLPAAGLRGSAGVGGCGMEGGYWTSTYGESSYDGPGAYHLYFMGTGVYTPNVYLRNYARFDGRSVRLVKVPTNTPGTSIGGFDANGASNARFSVSSNKQVRFSRGNLQYQASTGTWRFAEHQYDCVGTDNANISSTYNGWIDVFGWGTSGWNSGATCYQPWSTSTTYSDYYPGGSYTNSLTGDYANADWGVYNRISNGGNQPGMWRTLTQDEWNYLLFTRNASTISGTANARFTKATIGSATGLVVFPDSFTVPSGIALVDVNNAAAPFTANIFDATQWSQLETNGALFLPAAGDRNGTNARYVGTNAYYWTSTYYDESRANCVDFVSNLVYMNQVNRYDGHCVRLVMD